MSAARLVLVAVLLAGGMPVAAFAQATVRVTGIVVDERGQAVEFVTVNAPALRRGVAGDEGGRFAIEVPAGPCALEAMLVG